MNIKICNKCKGFNYKKVIDEINKNFSNVTYEIGCNNMCGIGRNKIVVIANNRPLVVENVNELIDKLKEGF